MNRWITQAVLLGLAINDANGNPLIPKSLLLSSAQAHDGNDDGFDPANAMFGWLAQCAEAKLDKETCLVTKTLEALFNMDDPSQASAPFPSRRRVLQEDQGGCRPDISNEELLGTIQGSRDACSQISINYSNEEFQAISSEFSKVFRSDSCWQELCENQEILVKLMFDHAVQCAQVEFDVDQCITDQIVSMLLPGPDSYDDDDDYYGGGGGTNHTHRVLRSLQGVMNGESNGDCVVVNEFELSFFASFVLMEAQGRCAALDVFVTPEDISKASADLVKLFGSPHCWGDTHACPDDVDDDAFLDFTPNEGEQLLDHFMIAVKYVEQCANIDLNLDSCMTMKTIDFFKSWGSSSSSSSMHRLLQESDNIAGDEECIVPEIDEATLNVIAFEAKQQCMAATGTPISDQEYSSSVEVMQGFLDAQNCWLALCAEDETPSRMLLEIIFEEIGICAQANLDAIDPCLLNQIFELIFVNSEGGEGSLGDVRRKLQRSLSHHHGSSEEPCAEQPSDAEVYFIINLLLAGASESCDVSSSQVSSAEAELFKLFRAESCWGENTGCEHNDDHISQVAASYLEFVENSAIDMLAQCAEITEDTCVLWRSVEALRFMGDAQAENSNDGPLLKHAFQKAAVCKPPSVTDSDIMQIVDHAHDHCKQIGLPVESHHPSQAFADLQKLIAKPECFEDVCSPESREMIIEEWMDECASLDTKFLTRSDYSSDPLGNEKLRCMTKYLMQTQTGGPEDPWECSLPHISPSICGMDPTNPSDVMKEAFIYCSGGEMSHPPSASPSPSPSPEMSMNAGEFLTDFSDAYFSFSMSYGPDDNHGDDTSAMLPFVLEVCHLLGDLDTDQARDCLKPVCDWGIEGALSFDDSGDINEEVEWKDAVPSYSPTTVSTSMQPTRPPSKQPTKKPTKKPTSSPTVMETGGVVEVTIEVAMTLSGIDTSDIDVKALDSVVALLENVIQDMLPEGAKVRLLKVGGFSLSRRLLRYLEEQEGEGGSLGVDVEFEVIFSVLCDGGNTCDDSKETLLKEADAFSSDIVKLVEDGSLEVDIKERATQQEIEVLKSISLSPASLKVSAPSATVTIVKEQQEDVQDEDSSSSIQGLSVGVAIIAGASIYFT
jgi:hypothetical protein